MIAWATIEDALVVAVKGASGLADVTWARESSAWRKAQYIVLERSPLSTIGIDARERKRIPNDPPSSALEQIVVRQHGQRSFALELQCTSDVGKASDTSPLDASDLLGQVQTRIRRRSVLRALRAAGVGLSAVGPVIRQAYEVDGRAMGRSLLSLTFLLADCDEDEDGEAIEHANAAVTLTTTEESPDAHERTVTVSAP